VHLDQGGVRGVGVALCDTVEIEFALRERICDGLDRFDLGRGQA
jgi:hypothetical protein